MGTALASTIIIILQLYNILILARILMSWVQVDRSNQFVRLVHDLTEPVGVTSNNDGLELGGEVDALGREEGAERVAFATPKLGQVEDALLEQ